MYVGLPTTTSLLVTSDDNCLNTLIFKLQTHHQFGMSLVSFTLWRRIWIARVLTTKHVVMAKLCIYNINKKSLLREGSLGFVFVSFASGDEGVPRRILAESLGVHYVGRLFPKERSRVGLVDTRWFSWIAKEFAYTIKLLLRKWWMAMLVIAKQAVPTMTTIGMAVGDNQVRLKARLLLLAAMISEGLAEWDICSKRCWCLCGCWKF